MRRRFQHAYGKVRSWHVSPLHAFVRAFRYALTGDTGRIRTHGGWSISRMRLKRDVQGPQGGGRPFQT